MSWNWALYFVLAVVVYQIIFFLYQQFTKTKLAGKHVLITGGSEGLGLALACEVVAQGAHVTIMSRSQKKLDAAAAKIKKLLPGNSQTVTAISADVTNEKKLQSAIAKVETARPIDICIPCAGFAATGRFLKVPMKEFRRCMEINYFGLVNTVRACADKMVARRSGDIILVSSGMALTAYHGYSAYAPTKWAIRGLGDCLRNELLPFNVRVFQAYPPNMDTPGYVTENKTKPKETQKIEDGETLYSPEHVAKCLIDSFRKGEYHIACGDLGLNVLVRGVAGMSPRNNTVADIFLLPIVALVGKIYGRMWDRIVCDGSFKGVRDQKLKMQ